MKKIVLFPMIVLFWFKLIGQNDAESYIKEALDFLTKKDYKQAQMSLQDAINNINALLAQQVAESLPAEINGLKADEAAEVNPGALGIIGGGMQITKRYQHPANEMNDAEVQILANSPLLATMSMYLTNPTMLGPDYKSVRVGAVRSLLKSEMQDYDNNGTTQKIRSTEIQIPLGQTLIIMHTNGFATEKDELDFATKLDLEKIRTMLGG